MNSITQEPLELLKRALAAPDDALAKSISTATGLVAYDLQAPAKNLYPFITPIRNVMPRVGGGTGTATNWRQVNAIIGSGFDAMGWVPEGQRSGQMSYSGPLLRYDTPVDGSAGEYQLTASGVVQFYYNPFAIYGGLRIPIKIHPRVPPGTIIGWAENLPIQYQSNEVPNVAELKTRQDYYQIDWPIVTRQRQVGVYAEEVLAVYAPFAMGVITNIANG